MTTRWTSLARKVVALALLGGFGASLSGCIIVGDRRRSRSNAVYHDGKHTHEHCHPKKHGRSVCHAHPHRDTHH